jgi:defect in organelle trafficking protein DotA
MTMKKWFYTLWGLLLFSASAFASSSDPQLYSDAVANKTDLSIAYLSSVFGTVSGVLNGTSGQMLGKLMYQFNQGMLVVAGCWLGFSVLSMVFKATLNGSFMQQDNKVPMILLRVALGFGLLIPNPSTGYTVLQGIIMQVTVQSVKLANQVWEYGLDYMSAGGALWSRPVAQTGSATPSEIISQSDRNAILGDQNTVDVSNFSSLGMIQKIMSMEACMVQSSIDYENKNSDSDGVSSTANFSVYEDDDNFRFTFPGGTGSDNNSQCGLVRWDVVASKTLNCQVPQNGTPTDDNSGCGFSRLALREAIFELLPAVKKYVCIKNNSSAASACNGIDPSTVDPSYMSDAMMAAMLNYKNLIDPLVRSDALSSAGNPMDLHGPNGEVQSAATPNPLNFIKQAKIEGWMTAGRYYWDLLRVEGSYDRVMTDAKYRNYIPYYNGEPDTSGLDKSTPKDLMADTIGDNGFIAKVNSDVHAFTGAASSGNAARSMSASFSGGLKWLLLILGPIFAELVGLMMAFSTNVGPLGLGPEPILWLHNIGMYCISLGGNIWLGIGFALFPIFSIMGACSAISPIKDAMKSVLDWMQPFFLIAAAGFFAVGVSLGFYIPLYPYMLFTFGVIGWIVSVIEAMVAAPVIALGITHTEGGHDFLGRSAQGLMLLVGLFLRPVLMLIGLFAGMILCQVSLSIVLYTFSGFASDIFYIAQPISGAPGGDVLIRGVTIAMSNVAANGDGAWVMHLILPLMVFPLFLMIFTMLVYTVTTNCFSLTYQLPNYILSWIGGPQPHTLDAASMAGEVKQGIGSVAGKASDALSRSVKKKGDTKLSAPANPDGNVN